MIEVIYFFCDEDHDPSYKITFTIDDTKKTYLVCEKCATFDHFSEHIIKKEKIDSSFVTNGGKNNE